MLWVAHVLEVSCVLRTVGSRYNNWPKNIVIEKYIAIVKSLPLVSGQKFPQYIKKQASYIVMARLDTRHVRVLRQLVKTLL